LLGNYLVVQGPYEGGTTEPKNLNIIKL